MKAFWKDGEGTLISVSCPNINQETKVYVIEDNQIVEKQLSDIIKVEE